MQSYPPAPNNCQNFSLVSPTLPEMKRRLWEKVGHWGFHWEPGVIPTPTPTPNDTQVLEHK